MEVIPSRVKRQFELVYLNDIVIFSMKHELHIDHVSQSKYAPILVWNHASAQEV